MIPGIVQVQPPCTRLPVPLTRTDGMFITLCWCSFMTTSCDDFFGALLVCWHVGFVLVLVWRLILLQ